MTGVINMVDNKTNTTVIGFKRIGNFSFKLLRLIVICGICYYIIYPIIENVLFAFMTYEDLYDLRVGIIPKHWTLDNFKLVIRASDFWESSLNTLFISLLITVTQLVSCTLVGYGFARFKFPLKKLLFALVILVLIVPPQLIITPLYLNMRYFDIFGLIKLFNGQGLNLLNSPIVFAIIGFTCMGLKNGLYIYLIRQFYRNMPKELEEAAKIDGAGYYKTFLKVMLPSAKPILFIVGLFSFVWQWTDAFYSSWFLPSVSTLAVRVSGVSGDLNIIKEITGSSNLDIKLGSLLDGTGAVLIMIPLVILFICTRKLLIGGIERSGIVG